MTPEAIATIVIAGCGLVGGVVESVRLWSRWARRHRRLWDELLGTDDQPGVPGKPGMSARVTAIDERLKVVEGHTAQLVPNGGESLFDKVKRIDQRTGGAS